MTLTPEQQNEIRAMLAEMRLAVARMTAALAGAIGGTAVKR